MRLSRNPIAQLPPETHTDCHAGVRETRQKAIVEASPTSQPSALGIKCDTWDQHCGDLSQRYDIVLMWFTQTMTARLAGFLPLRAEAVEGAIVLRSDT